MYANDQTVILLKEMIALEGNQIQEEEHAFILGNVESEMSLRHSVEYVEQKVSYSSLELC